MTAEWEGAVLLWIQECVRNSFLTPVFQWITFLGNAGIIWIALALILTFMKNTRKAGIAMFVAIILSFLINNWFLKVYVGRIRPYEVIQGLHILIDKPKDFSFPSGHTACSVAAAAAFWMAGNMVWEKGRWYYPLGIGMTVLAAAISFSRLYLGVHYPTDVLFGAFSGLLLGWISVKLTKWGEKYLSGG